MFRRTEEFRVYSNAGGDQYRHYCIEMIEDLPFSRPLGIDRMSRIAVRASGPVLSAILNGSEELVSISVQPYCRREIYIA